MKNYANILLSTEKYRKKRDYWMNSLEGLEMERLIQSDGLYNQNPPAASPGNGKITHILNADTSEQIIKLSKNSDITLYIVLLSSFIVFLHKYTGKDDIFLATPVYEAVGVETLYNDMVVVRKRMVKNTSFKDFLMDMRENFIVICENQDYPFEEIIEELTFVNETSYDLFFDIIFASETIHKMEYIYRKDHNLTVTFSKHTNNIRFCFQYNESIYCYQEIERLIESFSRLLGILLSNISSRLFELDLLTFEKKRKILFDFNDTEVHYPRKPIHQLFEDQVKRTPDHIAVRCENVHLSYHTLNGNANQLALALRGKGVTNDVLLGLVVDHSVELVVGILGILKAGGAYLPLDPQYRSRVNFILADSGVKLLLTTKELANSIEFNKDMIYLDDEIYRQYRENIGNINKLTDLVYIIYTSGTTGKPKGAMIEHLGLVNYIWWAAKVYVGNERINFPLYTSISFDFTVTSIFTPLVTGNAIVVYGSRGNEFLLDKIIEENTNNVVKLTPSHLKLIKNKKVESSIIKRFIVGGENLLTQLSRETWENFDGNIEIYNEYGPTETVVGCMIHQFNPGKDCRKSVPIGIPADNVRIFILDRHQNPLVGGIPGELYISGEGVARGYLNRCELTKERFIPDPFAAGETMYKTGDLARMLPDDKIEFLGRIDQQVSINGYRIEPGEIENQLLAHGEIEEAAVIYRENKEEEKYLCAYYVSRKNFTVPELREYLGSKLPQYMIPMYFVKLTEIPLTPNGKVNKNALPKTTITAGMEKNYVAPRNQLEEILAETLAEVLEVERIGIDDVFFEMGMDSIKAIEISAKLRERGLKVELNDIFLNPTINQLSKLIKPLERTINQELVKGNVQLTPIQRWFFENHFTDIHHFNMSIMLFKKTGIDQEIIANVFLKIVEHHDMLRTVYEWEGSKYLQETRGLKEKLFDLEVIDIGNAKDIENKIANHANEIQEGIDLKTGPLVKLGIFKTNQGDYLLVVIHHLVVDSVSFRILIEDISVSYGQAERGERIKFQDKTDSFKLWANDLVKYSESEELLKELEYWKLIEETNVELLPKDNHISKEKKKSKSIVEASMKLNKDETRKLLKEAHRKYNTKINDLLLTALGKAVENWARIKKVLINLEGHGREEIIRGVDISRTVGWFTSIFPVVLDMSESENLSYAINLVKKTLSSIPNKGIGYGILKYLTPEKRKNGILLEKKAEINFNYLGQMSQESHKTPFILSGMKKGERMSGELERDYTIDITGIVFEGELLLSFSYNRYQYKGETIETLVGYYKTNLLEIIEHCINTNEEEMIRFASFQERIKQGGYIEEELL